MSRRSGRMVTPDWNDVLPPAVAKAQMAWERRQLVLRLRAAGVSVRDIAARLELGPTRVRQIEVGARRQGGEPPPIVVYFIREDADLLALVGDKEAMRRRAADARIRREANVFRTAESRRELERKRAKAAKSEAPLPPRYQYDEPDRILASARFMALAVRLALDGTEVKEAVALATVRMLRWFKRDGAPDWFVNRARRHYREDRDVQHALIAAWVTTWRELERGDADWLAAAPANDDAAAA